MQIAFFFLKLVMQIAKDDDVTSDKLAGPLKLINANACGALSLSCTTTTTLRG